MEVWEGLLRWCVGCLDIVLMWNCTDVDARHIALSVPTNSWSSAARSRQCFKYVSGTTVHTYTCEKSPGSKNCQQTSTRNTAFPFGNGQRFAEVVHKTFTTILLLERYTTNPNIAVIGVDNELLPWLRLTQDRCRTQRLFQCLESCLRFRGPLECPFLFSQFGQWLTYISGSGDEPPVIRTQTENPLTFWRRN